MQYIKAHGHKLRNLIAENVLGLLDKPKDDTCSTSGAEGQDKSNKLDFCVFMLEDVLDMWVFVAVLSPILFRDPVTRDRVWILAMPIRILRAAGMSKEQATSIAQGILNRMILEEARGEFFPSMQSAKKKSCPPSL